MVKAKEAQAIVQAEIEVETKIEWEKAGKFCEGLSSEIVSHSRHKITSFSCRVPASVRRAYVIRILKDNGYTITIDSDSGLQISW